MFYAAEVTVLTQIDTGTPISTLFFSRGTDVRDFQF